MNIQKAILILAALSLTAAVPLSLRAEEPALASNAKGTVQVSDEGGNAYIEFEVQEGKDNKAASGSFHFRLDDGSRDSYVEVAYVKVDGEYAWFAGDCTRDNAGMAGRWLFIAVHDGGRPGRLVDHIWLEWLPKTPDAENIAKRKVENLEKPANNKPIKTGDIVVNCY